MKIFVTIAALLLHQVLGDGQSELASRASNEFSNKLYTEVAKEPGNVLVCPISLHIALAVLHQAAGGSTASQLAKVLSFNDSDKNSIKQSYKGLLSGIKDNNLKIATKLFPSNSYQLKQDFVQTAQHHFSSDVQGVDYRKRQAAADTINKYVEEKTNHKIHDLISVDAINDYTRLIIVNAVHFNANWKIPFPHAYEDDFKVTPSERVKTRMMTVTDQFMYKDLPEIGAKMLKMDYENGDYSMVIVLPNADDGLNAVESKLSSMSLAQLLNGMSMKKVEVTIPKFKLEQTIQLKDKLIKMGLTEMFSPGANLREMSHTDNLFVSDVIQKTFINVHENGTEAAAATGFLEVLSAQTDRVLFYARRPFHVYLIHWRDPSLVLFEGRFAGPFGQNFLEPHDSDENLDFPQEITEKDTNFGNSQGGIHQNNRPTRPNTVTGNRVISRPGNSDYNIGISRPRPENTEFSTQEAINPGYYGQSNNGYDNNEPNRFLQRPPPTPLPGPYYQSTSSYLDEFRKRQTSPHRYSGQYDEAYRGLRRYERQQYPQSQ